MPHDVFHAIADPNRRAILDLLARRRLSLNEVAGHFSISRPAVSKHVKVLSECGLVEIRRRGRERFCEARPEKLRDVSKWIERYHRLWIERLDALGRYLEDIQRETPPEKKSSTPRRQRHEK